MGEDKRKIIIVSGILIFLIVFMGTRDKLIEPLPIAEGVWDISEQVSLQNLQQYLIEEVDFDYTHPRIQEIAQNIKSTTATPYDAIKATAKYVYNNIQYSSKISVGYCYEETASSALEQGVGDCVSMTRLNVAILRAMGIPARSNGGCLASSGRCTAIFAVAPPEVQAQVTEMVIDDFKKRGFLHEWLEVFDGEKWYILEATSGQLFTSSCPSYIQYAYDNNRFDRCVIASQSFWNLCAGS